MRCGGAGDPQPHAEMDTPSYLPKCPPPSPWISVLRIGQPAVTVISRSSFAAVGGGEAWNRVPEREGEAREVVFNNGPASSSSPTLLSPLSLPQLEPIVNPKAPALDFGRPLFQTPPNAFQSFSSFCQSFLFAKTHLRKKPFVSSIDKFFSRKTVAKMRLTVATAALAGAALAAAEGPQSTVYQTTYYTITSCPPEVPCTASSTVVTSSVPLTTSTIYTTTTKTVTDCDETATVCPGESTRVVTETIPIGTTVCPVEPTETAEQPQPTDVGEYPGQPEQPEQPEQPTDGPAPPEQPSEQPEQPQQPQPTTSVGWGNSTGPAVPPPYPTTTLIEVPAPECQSTSVRAITTSITTVIPTTIYETIDIPCETAPPVTSQPSNPIPGKPTPTPSTPVTAGAASLGGSALLAVAAGLVALLA